MSVELLAGVALGVVAAIGCAGAYYGNAIAKRVSFERRPTSRRGLPLVAIESGPCADTRPALPPVGKRLCGDCKHLTVENRRYTRFMRKEACILQPILIDPIDGKPQICRPVYLVNSKLDCELWEAK